MPKSMSVGIDKLTIHKPLKGPNLDIHRGSHNQLAIEITDCIKSCPKRVQKTMRLTTRYIKRFQHSLIRRIRVEAHLARKLWAQFLISG